MVSSFLDSPLRFNARLHKFNDFFVKDVLLLKRYNILFKTVQDPEDGSKNKILWQKFEGGALIISLIQVVPKAVHLNQGIPLNN